MVIIPFQSFLVVEILIVQGEEVLVIGNIDVGKGIGCLLHGQILHVQQTFLDDIIDDLCLMTVGFCGV